MAIRLTTFALMLLCGPGIVSAGDRVAVLEFFGRPAGAFCSEAGPAMIALQRELEGEAVLLEYDFDQFREGRQDRFWATGVHADYLPLVMVGSGYRTSSGQTDYETVYRRILSEELARPSSAEIAAYWRRRGGLVRTYVSVSNSGSSDLLVEEEAAIWVVAYEKAPIGVSNTWVRAQERWPLVRDLAPGETVGAVIDALPVSVGDWDRLAGVVLVEDRPGGDGRYDIRQATQATPATLAVVPEELMVTMVTPSAELVLRGPHVLQWSATADVPWVEIHPTAGVVPETVVLTVNPELRPPTQTTATVTFHAVGDGMDFEETTEVVFGMAVRRNAGGRRHPDP